jgi:hypothetical protein
MTVESTANVRARMNLNKTDTVSASDAADALSACLSTLPTGSMGNLADK